LGGAAAGERFLSDPTAINIETAGFQAVPFMRSGGGLDWASGTATLLDGQRLNWHNDRNLRGGACLHCGRCHSIRRTTSSNDLQTECCGLSEETGMSEQAKKKAPTTHEPCLPFLKWPGGKRWLAPTLAGMIGEVTGTYYEPFLGGGAVFFHLRPARAVLSDANPELVSVYRQVRDRVSQVIEGLGDMKISRQAFYQSRSERPNTPVGRAIRFLYLNKTAFNGMYRVNHEGEFNVPFGCKPGTVLCDPRLFRAAAIALRTAVLRVSDFEDRIAHAGKADVVYCDPPFTVKHDNNGFIRYNESLFSWADQERLAQACAVAAARGVRVFVSNAHHDAVRELYRGFRSRLLKRHSLISGQMNGRGTVSEYLLTAGPGAG